MPPAPRLFFWGARALYLGRAFGLSPHRNAAAVLCLGVDGRFAFARDPGSPASDYVECRSLFIPANTLHHLRVGAVLMAFLYVDPLGSDARAITGLAGSVGGRAAYDLRNETRLSSVLRALAQGAISWDSARAELSSILGLGPRSQPDPRIVEALRTLREAPADPHTLASLARAARLSPSRFLHLFKATTGLPLRRYKMWIRMGAALQAMAKGTSLTQAALDAGFASSAHFSAAFHEMFGMEPSRLVKHRFEIAGTRDQQRQP